MADCKQIREKILKEKGLPLTKKERALFQSSLSSHIFELNQKKSVTATNRWMRKMEYVALI